MQIIYITIEKTVLPPSNMIPRATEKVLRGAAPGLSVDFGVVLVVVDELAPELAVGPFMACEAPFVVCDISPDVPALGTAVKEVPGVVVSAAAESLSKPAVIIIGRRSSEYSLPLTSNGKWPLSSALVPSKKKSQLAEADPLSLQSKPRVLQKSKVSIYLQTSR